MNGDLAHDLFAEFLTAARRAEREAVLAEKALVASLIGPCPGCVEPCGQCSR